MRNLLFDVSVYSLGFLGLAGITLLPWRVVQFFRHQTLRLRRSVVGKIAFYVFVAAAILLLAFWATQLAHVVDCLMGERCHSNRAQGWISVIPIGIIYAGLEVTLLIGWLFTTIFARSSR